MPTKFESTLVDTPTKVELIQTVAGCDMKEGCYRIPYVEYHYEITYTDDGHKEEKLKVGLNKTGGTLNVERTDGIDRF